MLINYAKTESENSQKKKIQNRKNIEKQIKHEMKNKRKKKLENWKNINLKCHDNL
jgi:NAD+--asparagine ADP-ribosyltransferase